MNTIGLTILGFLAGSISLFLMFLILIQRGKGGGLTGALGGAGGQSAFGSKAGDLFTRITVITAIVWMTCCLLIIKVYNYPPATAEAVDAAEVTGDENDAGLTGEGTGDSTPDAGTTPDADATPGEGEAAQPEGGEGEASNPDDPVIGNGESEGEGEIEAPANTEGETPAEGESTGNGENESEDDNN